MHDAAYRYVWQATKGLVAPDGCVLEIGSRDVNGSIRGLFGARRYIGSDVAPGRGVDVVAPGESVVPPEPPAIVVTTEVLEHTTAAQAICRHAYALLQPGGVFIVTCAGEGRAPHSAVDGGPIRSDEYYANVTKPMLASWLSDFSDVTIVENTQAKDIYALAIKAAA